MKCELTENEWKESSNELFSTVQGVEKLQIRSQQVA